MFGNEEEGREMMAYAWDQACPKCSEFIAGGMGEDDERMEREQGEYRGKIIHCRCGAYVDFDSGREVEIVDGC